MGVLCASPAKSTSAAATAAVGDLGPATPKSRASSIAAAAARRAAKRHQASQAKEQQKRSTLSVDARSFRDKYMIVRAWKSKKRRHAGVGGGLRDQYGVWDVAVDISSAEQPHRTALAVPKRALLAADDMELRRRVARLKDLGCLHDAFCEGDDLMLIYDYDPEEVLPVIDAGYQLTEAAAAAWTASALAALIRAHASGVFLGVACLSRVVGAELATATLVGLGVLGGLVAGPWLSSEEPLKGVIPVFAAPELWSGEGEVGELSDAWAIGVLLYQIMSGGPPSGAKAAAFRPSFEAEHWAQVSPACVELVRGLTAEDPRRRWSVVFALREAAWLQGGAGEGATSEGADADGGSRCYSKTVLSDSAAFRESLQSFQRTSALHRAARLIVAEQMPRSALLRVERAFRRFDLDSDGLLSAEEVRSALRSGEMQVPGEELPAELEELLVAASKAEGLDFVEFAAVLLKQQELQQHENLLAAFRRIDADGSGLLSRRELAAAISSVVSGARWVGNGRRSQAKADGAAHDQELPQELAPELDVLMDQADLNGDGLIDFEEFAELLRTDGELLRRVLGRRSGGGGGGGAWGGGLLAAACCPCGGPAEVAAPKLLQAGGGGGARPEGS